MSSKKRTKNKKHLRDKKLRKRGQVVQTKRSPKNQLRWDKNTGHARRMLNRQKYFKHRQTDREIICLH